MLHHVTCYNHRLTVTVTVVTSQSSQHNYDVEMYYSSYVLSYCCSFLLIAICVWGERLSVGGVMESACSDNNNPSMKLLNQSSVTYITVFPHLSHTIILHTPSSLPASGLVSCFQNSVLAVFSKPRLLLPLIDSCCCCTLQYAKFISFSFQRHFCDISLFMRASLFSHFHHFVFLWTKSSPQVS